jgi:hypothetical protein
VSPGALSASWRQITAMRSLVPALVMSGLLLSGSSCNLLLPIDCTQIGCSDELSIAIRSPAAERYRVTLLVAGAEIAVSEVDCGNPPACHASFEETPREATVRIEVRGGPVIEHLVRPGYEPRYPNGRRCDRTPVCHRGRVALRGPDAAG